MKRGYAFRIQDILDCISAIESYITSKTEEDFFIDRMLQDAVIRRLEIIGEAAKHIPDDIRAQYPDIPWKKMAGLRDIAIHDYVELVQERIWKTLINELPKTRKQIEKAQKELLSKA
jgi:uncharacterized protein with HEPN domain